MSENHSQNCVICNNKLQGPPFKPPDLTPLRKVRVQEAAPFAVHRGGLYWTTICMMREWGDQMLYVSLYLCCNKSGTLGSLFWLDREKMTALGYKKNLTRRLSNLAHYLSPPATNNQWTLFSLSILFLLLDLLRSSWVNISLKALVLYNAGYICKAMSKMARLLITPGKC